MLRVTCSSAFQDFEATHEIVQAPLWDRGTGTSVSAVNVPKLSCTVENFCLLKLSRLLDSDKAQQRTSSRGDLGLHCCFLNMLRSKIVMNAEYRENYCG